VPANNQIHSLASAALAGWGQSWWFSGLCIRMGPIPGLRGVNHCLLEVAVLEAPQLRYTQDNQTPVAEMTVQVDGLRPDDPPGQLKVVGWGNLAQDLQNRVQPGARLVIEGRLRMVTQNRPDGIKEKRAEFTLARLHPLAAAGALVGAAAGQSMAPAGRPAAAGPGPSRASVGAPTPADQAAAAVPQAPTWNASPLVPDLPDEDDIPF
jgi:single-strand DNA-binding protein